jgi:iron complex outermembrane recepter protein
VGPTYQGHATWKDETTWNYEIGSKSRIMGDRGSFNVSAFYLEIRDLQATVTAGSCSSRIILGVPKSRSVGGEAELSIAPDQHFDFSVSASVSDAKIRSTVTSAPGPDGSASVVARIVAGSRLPSVPEFQTSAAATYRWGMGGATGHASGTYQHVGSRLTQVGDSSLAFPASLPPGTLDMTTFGANTIGGR